MKKQTSKPKICIVTTIDLSLDKLFPDLYSLLIFKGYEVVGICADGPYLENVRQQGVRTISVPMTRKFTPVQDLKCLWMLYKIFKQEKFNIVHYSTPKAAFLSAIAGRLAGCPVLLYTLRGLGYTSFVGLRKSIAKLCEKIACRSAHYVIAISKSLKKEAVEENLLSKGRIKVIGMGSSKGVNLDQFRLNEKTATSAKKIRQGLGISNDDVVIGYAGRLTKEKGIIELLAAFANIRKINYTVDVLLVGDQDQRNPLPDEILRLISKDTNIHMVPFNNNVVNYIAAMDIVVLPSYREGFGNVLIEASAMEKPVVGTNITGCCDAILNGTTGILVQPRDVVSLEKALKELIGNPSKRVEMGRNGKQWVMENFDRKLVWNKIVEVYEQLLS